MTTPGLNCQPHPEVRRSLHRIVERLTSNSAMHEDLMQQALIHLWQIENVRPGQSRAWYLQDCRLHLQNYLRRGRSVDSAKHSWAQIPNPAPLEDWASLFDPPDSDGAFWEEINAKDIISVLSRWLKPEERLALLCLAEGLSHREIAKRLNVSHTLVAKYRRHIALLAAKLGIPPLRMQAEEVRRSTGPNDFSVSTLGLKNTLPL